MRGSPRRGVPGAKVSPKVVGDLGLFLLQGADGEVEMVTQIVGEGVVRDATKTWIEQQEELLGASLFRTGDSSRRSLMAVEGHVAADATLRNRRGQFGWKFRMAVPARLGVEWCDVWVGIRGVACGSWTLDRGERVRVEGRVERWNWTTKQGKRGVRVEIAADRVECTRDHGHGMEPLLESMFRRVRDDQPEARKAELEMMRVRGRVGAAVEIDDLWEGIT